MTVPFRQLHHVCIVVRDIDSAMAYYETLGIGPWEQYPPLTGYSDLEVPNTDAFLKMKYRFVNLDNVQIQLCEPPRRTARSAGFSTRRATGSSTSASSPRSTTVSSRRRRGACR
jgi:catechol 2,3-dioxygenase-like lactoylglutathione lyase family enzyme